MNNKIAIILTSIERPQALKKSIESILAIWQENWILMIGIQDDYESKSYAIITNIINTNNDKAIRLYDLEYDCGISKARNELIQKASLWNIPYILLTADSIEFDDSMKDINYITDILDREYYNLIGLQLNNRIGWEAKLKLIEGKSFELDFIEKDSKEGVWGLGYKIFNVWNCDIVRNFWIAKTQSLITVPYDERLIMAEHEDFFYQFTKAGNLVGYTNLCSGTYNKIKNTPEYDKIRSTNFNIGVQRLKDKYSLKSWIDYKHLERTQL